MSLPLEKILKGKYEIIANIAEGGIGSIYKVRHLLLDDIRAIKVLRPQLAARQELQKRFLQEARMAIRLEHPNIARLHDFAIADDGTAYIVMEFIDGVGLDALLTASGPPSIDLTLEIGCQSLDALSYLHENDFVHRDISPDNLMLTRDYEGRPLVKLIDLGIAKDLSEEAGLTEVGTFLGKIRYCAPEQFSAEGGAAKMDQRSDNYSFGVLLYELLTGEYPFHGESFEELISAHLFQPPREFEETDPEGRIPQRLRDLVLAALKKDPEERIATADEFAERLASFQNPSAEFNEEADDKVETTTSFLLDSQDFRKPGSTQDRLDKQFGMGPTPVPPPAHRREGFRLLEEPGERSAEVAKRIEKLLQDGLIDKAETALGIAVQTHGQAELFDALLKKIKAARRPQVRATNIDKQGRVSEPVRTGASSEIDTTVASGVVAARARAERRKMMRGRWLGARARSLVVIGIAVTLLVLLAAVATRLLVLGDGRQVADTELTPENGPAAGARQLERTERWDASRMSPAELKLAETVSPPLRAGQEVRRGGEQTVPTAASQSPVAPVRRPIDELSDERLLADPEPDDRTKVAQAQPGQLFKAGAGVVPPELLNLSQPPYPKAPKGGLVVNVAVLVGKNGKVLTATVKEGRSFKRRFREAAVAVAELATFRPATRHGKAGTMWTEVRIVFTEE